MKVLILGGNGFIGKNLAEYLLNKNIEVYSFDYVHPQQKRSEITYLQGDFFNDDTLKEILKGKDVVYHAISTINPGNSNELYMQGYSKDFLQTIKLCQYMEITRGKLIFLSSGGTVYGNQFHLPITEEVTPHPINHYGNLKLCIENTMLTFAYQNKLNAVVARISNPYGPGQDYRKGVGFIDATIKNAIEGKTLEVWGNGTNIRDYIYITDVCKMLTTLSLDTENSGSIINISSGNGTSMNEIIEIVKKHENSLNVVYRNARSVDLNTIILDNSKIMKVYHDKLIDIEEGISKYYDLVKLQYTHDMH